MKLRILRSEVFCVPQKVVADINNGNNLPLGKLHFATAKLHLEQTSLLQSKNFTRINPRPIPHTILVEEQAMRDKREENGAAQMAWQLFEKTGSISYYMLYYDILRKK